MTTISPTVITNSPAQDIAATLSAQRTELQARRAALTGLMRRFVSFLAVLLATSWLAGCSQKDEIEACTAMGIAYFKEVGSYPTLKSYPDSGRTAEEVAKQRCNRTARSF